MARYDALLAAVLTLSTPLQQAAVSAASAAGSTTGGAAATVDAGPRPSKDWPGSGGFALLLRDAFLARLRMAGGTEVYATHVPDPAAEVERLQSRRKTDGSPVAVTLCAAQNQEELLQRLLPAADAICVMPFIVPQDGTPAAGEALWPQCANPFVNRVRHLRHVTAGKALYAWIDTSGTGFSWPMMRGERPPTIDEVEWCIWATIGADFDGIVWSSGHCPKWKQRLSRIESGLAGVSQELGRARPVAWVCSLDENFCTALATQRQLFVVVLSAGCMKPDPGKTHILVPVSSGIQKGTVRLDLPAGTVLKSSRDLAGNPLATSSLADGTAVEYQCRGGGTMLVFDIGSAKAEDGASRSP